MFACVQDALGKIAPVVYVDILEGDAEGHIRFHSPEEAKAVSDARAELHREHSWKLEILSGRTGRGYRVVWLRSCRPPAQ